MNGPYAARFLCVMNPTQCREQAEALRLQADRTRDAKVRAQLLLMAEDWDKLATDAEELERRLGHAP